MSILIQWDNPQEAYTPEIQRVALWRGHAGAGQCINQDACWGFEEDPDATDPLGIYTIEYRTALNGVRVLINIQDLKVFPRLPEICEIQFALTRPDGSPYAARTIDITDAASGGTYDLRILTNRAGKARFFGLPGRRLQFHIDGEPTLLDAIVPDTRLIAFSALTGTRLPADTRCRAP